MISASDFKDMAALFKVAKDKEHPDNKRACAVLWDWLAENHIAPTTLKNAASNAINYGAVSETSVDGFVRKIDRSYRTISYFNDKKCFRFGHYCDVRPMKLYKVNIFDEVEKQFPDAIRIHWAGSEFSKEKSLEALSYQSNFVYVCRTEEQINGNPIASYRNMKKNGCLARNVKKFITHEQIVKATQEWCETFNFKLPVEIRMTSY